MREHDLPDAVKGSNVGPKPDVNWPSPLPSAFIEKICWPPPPRSLAKTIDFPSVDQRGRR